MSVRSDGRPWKSEVAGSNPATQTSLCSGGREAQCTGLQTRKTVSSNLTRYSNLLPLKPLMDEVLSCKQGKSVRFRTGAPNNATLADVVIASGWSPVETGSIPVGCTKFILELSGAVYTLANSRECQHRRWPQGPSLCVVRLMVRSLASTQ